MKAIELYHQDGRSAGVWYCEGCRIVHRTEEDAHRCCAPVACKECGEPVCRKHVTICDPCVKKREAAKERERFEKAEKVTEWDGWIYCAGVAHDDFFQNVEDFREAVESRLDEGEELVMPDYVWTCSTNRFAQLDLDQVLDPIAGEAYEDFETDDLNGLTELEAAIEAFNKANEEVVSYYPDFKRALVIAKPEPVAA